MNPWIIPIFLPCLGCSQRCLFCNQKVTAESVPSPSLVRITIEEALKHLPTEVHVKREKQVAFYGGSFTAIHRERQISYLDTVRPFLAQGLLDSIRLSTRPDAVDEETLLLLRRYGVKTVEIGAQSMIDEVLSRSQRGHSARDIRKASWLLRQMRFETGLHLMIGLPGDTYERFLKTIEEVVSLGPDFVRIHPTLVLRGAPLETLWRNGRYIPLSLEEALRWLKAGLLLLGRFGIRVARVGLQSTQDLERHLVAGPYHPALHHLVESEILLDMARHLLRREGPEEEALFLCHPKEVSNLRGQRNENIHRLRREFGLRSISIQSLEAIERGSLHLQGSKRCTSIKREELLCQSSRDALAPSRRG